ncbi:hypothetical protein SLEP1_g10793 [Rubroshorea leprosula]|uniref:Uncharacterized protein n=1 Tax=Rubroshorea leprosula TaxID=152421 RepID=A0AAV5I970_9ROSI|nr:hypothetical protein SLEP1_g10793 [Rubroshorea leprosula]
MPTWNPMSGKVYLLPFFFVGPTADKGTQHQRLGSSNPGAGSSNPGAGFLRRNPGPGFREPGESSTPGFREPGEPSTPRFEEPKPGFDGTQHLGSRNPSLGSRKIGKM